MKFPNFHLQTLDYNAATSINFDSLEQLVDSLLFDTLENQAELSVTRPFITKKLGVIGTRVIKKRLRAVMNKVTFDQDYSTRPFGYQSVAQITSRMEVVQDFYTKRELPLGCIMPNTNEWFEYCAKHG